MNRDLVFDPIFIFFTMNRDLAFDPILFFALKTNRDPACLCGEIR